MIYAKEVFPHYGGAFMFISRLLYGVKGYRF